MKKIKKHQRGFGIIEIIILLVVVGVLALTGWWVYQNNRTKVSDAAKGTSQSANNPSITTNPGPAVTYLEIKEWGVRLPLGEGIKDAYYVVPRGISLDADGLPSGIIMGMHSLDASCGVVTSESPGFNNSFAEIVRALPDEKDPVSGRLYKELLPSGVTINGYYYGYSKMTQDKACASLGKLNSIDTAMMGAAKTMSRP